MPFTFNGIGTTIYGARDFKPDGSYIATEWLVFVYVPVIPYRSMRILPNGKTTNAVVYRSSGYQILQKTGINFLQVLSVYAFFAVFIGSLWAGIALQIPWLCAPGVWYFSPHGCCTKGQSGGWSTTISAQTWPPPRSLSSDLKKL
jgi:hypothetical protein